MTEDNIKEQLSNNFIGVLAARKGYSLVKPPDDSGVDYTVRFNIERIKNGKRKFYPSPYSCDLQLKATTFSSISIENQYIVYDLRSKNYDDLIDRRDDGSVPLVLILFILPDNKENWVQVLEDSLILSKHAFWFYPDATYLESNNESTKRIKIPISNRVDLTFFDQRIKDWIPQWK